MTERLFSAQQKRHLYLLSEGRCERCGEPLMDDWEAHHVIRFSDGGVTELTNAMALCVACHRSMHARRFMFEARGWQKDALDTFQRKNLKAFLLEATPGSGKTVFSAIVAKSVMESGETDFAVIVVPTTALKGDSEAGFLGDWNKVGVQLTTVLKAGKGVPKEFSGGIITYAQLPNIISTLEVWARNGRRLFVVFDEIHHASDDNVWGASADRLGECAAKILCMTGTPFRGDGRKIAFVEYNDKGVAVADFSYDYSEAVRDRVCRPVVFMTDDGFAEYIRNDEEYSVKLSEARPDQESDAAATIFRRDSAWLDAVLQKADAKLDEYRSFDFDAGGIVICRPGSDENDDKRLRQIAKLVQKITGETPEVITHEDEDANAKIERFRTGRARWICSVRKISEGVDIKRLRVMVMATRPGTELLFRQMVGRVVRVDDKDRPGDATVFVAKLPQLTRWAEQIREEAEAGLRKPAGTRASDGDGIGPDLDAFRAKRSSHEDGGAISDFGEFYAANEVMAAERVKAGDPQLAEVGITVIAHILRKLNVEIPDEVKHGKPLQLQKLEIRREINRLARMLAIQGNPSNPDYQGVWSTILQRTGAKSLDDLHDNHPIEVMHQVANMLSAMLASSHAAA